MDKIGEGLKNIILAGIGTAATTVEKSKDILDDMVKKGELTVEQGKVLNQELKHNIKKTVEKAKTGEDKAVVDDEDMDNMLDNMTPEQVEQLKMKLADMEAKRAAADVGEATETE